MPDTTFAPSSLAKPPKRAQSSGPHQREASERLRHRGGARLFGQFLLDQGAVTESELSAALALMAALNETIGALAVARGWLCAEQADQIAEMQRTIDAPWGDIAVALESGGLTPEQVEVLLWEQSEDNLRIGDALVEVGALSCSDAEHWLVQYDASRAINVVMADDPTGEYDPIRHAVDGLPRVLLRRAGLHAVCSAPRVWRSGPDTDSDRRVAATVELRGGWSVRIGLLLSGRLGRALANRARQNKGRKDTRAAIACDLLEVLGHYVGRRLERSYCPARKPALVGEPTPGPLPPHGLAFTIATDFGDAVLVIDQH